MVGSIQRAVTVAWAEVVFPASQMRKVQVRNRLSTSTWRFWLSVFFMISSCLRANTSDAGVVYDATADFTLSSNPSGTWSYLYSNDTVRDGSYSLFTEVDPLGVDGPLAWHADIGASTASRPWAGIKTTATGFGSWQVGELALHPGRSGNAAGDGLAILTWTSPVTGTVNVNYSLAMGLSGNVLWFFEKNDGTNTLDSGSLAGSAATDSILLTNVSVTAGDDLSLVIHNNGSVGNDLVRLTNATIEISSVPEPATAVAMGLLGILGFMGRRRRRTKIKGAGCTVECLMYQQCRTTLVFSPLIIALTFAGTTVEAGVTVLGPSAYVQFSDSPFDNQTLSWFYLEDFEDGSLNTLGVTASAGAVITPSPATDSVDADDGIIDGFGADGHSYHYYVPGGPGVTFTFDDTQLGALPTHVGLVLTDSNPTSGNTTITFYDSAGGTLALFGPYDARTGANTATAGDRFFGVIAAGGVSSIQVSDAGYAFELDHLQYGYSNAVPEPSTAIAMGLLGIVGFAGNRRRRRQELVALNQMRNNQ